MTPVVLLPGMMCDERLFRSQSEILGKKRSVIIPNLSQHASIAAMAKYVLQSAPDRFALAGLSMGGIVAMEMVGQAPDRIERLALMDTNHLAETPERQAKRVPQIDRVRQYGVERVMREEICPHYLIDTHDDRGILDLTVRMAVDLGPDCFQRQSIALRDRPDQTEALRQVICPTLILYGEGDRVCPAERHQEMADLIRTVLLQSIPAAGHLPPLENPGALNAALMTWLEA